jgi:hypothetical protein
MATHGCLMLYIFAMVKCQPCSFQIPSWLQTPHSVNTISRTINGHLEQETLRTTLPRENVIMDVIITISPFEL